MFRLALLFLFIALAAGAFGFGLVASTFGETAKIVFFVAIGLTVLSFLAGSFSRANA